MFELFMLGSLMALGSWFWIITLLELIFLFSFVQNKSGSGATISLIVFAFLLHYLFKINILGYIIANPIQVLCIAVLYFILGAFWGAFKWFLLVKEKFEKYDNLKKEFLTSELKTQDIPESIPKELKQKWKEHLSHYYYVETKAPKPMNHKADIIRWMSFWLIDSIWYLISDFIKNIFTAIYNCIDFRLQKISNYVFSKAKMDFEE